MDEEAMWKGFYHKIVEEKEAKEREKSEKTEHELRVQETDGGFFENLGTLLAEKARAQEIAEDPLPSMQEKLEDEQQDDDEKSIAEATEALLDSDSDRDENELVTDMIGEAVGWNIEELYKSVVYMTQHPVGYDESNECGQDALLNHLQQAFNVDNETHQQVLKDTKNMKAPVLHLNVEVIEAKELDSKDSNGLNDPFCALYLKSLSTQRYTTKVKTATLAPIWEEHFELPLMDAENDALCLEVWDFDPAETVGEKMSKFKEVKGSRGLSILMKELFQAAINGKHDNELIGQCKIPLKDIPVTGHTMWYSLEKDQKSKRRGLIRLRLAFTTEQNTRVAAQEYRHLLKILLLHELETKKLEKYCWCGKWSAAAEALMHQHSAQRGLPPKSVAMSQWLEYSKIHQKHPLNFAAFNKLAIDLLRPIDNGLFTSDEIKLFWEAARKILYSCFNGIRKIRRLAAGDKNVMAQMGAILGILSSISTLNVPDDFDLFPANIYGWFPESDGTKIDVFQALEYTVVQGGAEWWDHILKNNTLKTGSDDDAIECHIKVVQLVRADLQRALDSYDKIFIKKINFPYARTLYKMYEKRISDLCMIIVEDVCLRLKRIDVGRHDDSELKLGSTLFELYVCLQRFASLGQVLCMEDLEGMKIQNYHEWFMAGVAHWLDISVSKALQRIKNAVKFDNLESVDSNVQYSSSAVDTLTIFYSIQIFWTNLAWPDIEGSYTFIAKLIDDICRCSIAYADMMSSKAEMATQTDQQNERTSSDCEKKFRVSSAWCFAINNMDYIRTSIAPLAKDLGLQRIVDALGETKTQQEAERCQNTLQLIMDNTTDTVKNKIVELLEVVAQKMAPEMSRHLMKIAEPVDTTRNAIDRLLSYIEENIMKLHDNLNEENFQRVVLIIWEIMFDELSQLVNSNLEERKPPSFYSNLNCTLKSLKIFFKLNFDEISNAKALVEIERLLELHGMETPELIYAYYIERVEAQNNGDESIHGKLTVRAQFVDNSLQVQILNAMNLRSMDSNGNFIGKLSTIERKLHSKSKQRLRQMKTSLSDPYVVLKLLPEEKFREIKTLQTEVHKDNLYPLFEEKFTISLTAEQRNLKNAMLAFEVRDDNFISTKFMAEAFLQFSEIPDKGHDCDIESLNQTRLKLSRPTDTKTDVIKALERRKGDKQAMEFISKVNKRASK